MCKWVKAHFLFILFGSLGLSPSYAQPVPMPFNEDVPVDLHELHQFSQLSLESYIGELQERHQIRVIVYPAEYRADFVSAYPWLRSEHLWQAGPVQRIGRFLIPENGPHQGQPVILLREDATTATRVHEYIHFLVWKTRSDKGPLLSANQQMRLAEQKLREAEDRIRGLLEWAEAVESLLMSTLREEAGVNLLVIEHGTAWGLTEHDRVSAKRGVIERSTLVKETFIQTLASRVAKEVSALDVHQNGTRDQVLLRIQAFVDAAQARFIGFEQELTQRFERTNIQKVDEVFLDLERFYSLFPDVSLTSDDPYEVLGLTFETSPDLARELVIRIGRNWEGWRSSSTTNEFIWRRVITAYGAIRRQPLTRTCESLLIEARGVLDFSQAP